MTRPALRRGFPLLLAASVAFHLEPIPLRLAVTCVCVPKRGTPGVVLLSVVDVVVVEDERETCRVTEAERRRSAEVVREWVRMVVELLNSGDLYFCSSVRSLHQSLGRSISKASTKRLTLKSRERSRTMPVAEARVSEPCRLRLGLADVTAAGSCPRDPLRSTEADRRPAAPVAPISDLELRERASTAFRLTLSPELSTATLLILPDPDPDPDEPMLDDEE